MKEVRVTAKSKPALVQFRKINPRVDHYPTGPAMQAIEKFHLLHPGASKRAVIDALVVAGFKALTSISTAT